MRRYLLVCKVASLKPQVSFVITVTAFYKPTHERGVDYNLNKVGPHVTVKAKSHVVFNKT